MSHQFTQIAGQRRYAVAGPRIAIGFLHRLLGQSVLFDQVALDAFGDLRLLAGVDCHLAGHAGDVVYGARDHLRRTAGVSGPVDALLRPRTTLLDCSDRLFDAGLQAPDHFLNLGGRLLGLAGERANLGCHYRKAATLCTGKRSSEGIGPPPQSLRKQRKLASVRRLGDCRQKIAVSAVPIGRDAVGPVRDCRAGL